MVAPGCGDGGDVGVVCFFDVADGISYVVCFFVCVWGFDFVDFVDFAGAFVRAEYFSYVWRQVRLV